MDVTKEVSKFVKFIDSEKENSNYGPEISLALNDKIDIAVLPLESENLSNTIEYLKQKNEHLTVLKTKEFDSPKLKYTKAKIQKNMNIKMNSHSLSQFETLREYIKEKQIKNLNIIMLIT